MKAWRSVGLMAFLVTALTATNLLAEPTTPTDRTWLRQSAQRAAAPTSTAQLTLGKWAALALLLGFAGFALWKRRQVKKANPLLVMSQVQIGGVTKISPKAQLVVATVNGRSMLLGVTDASIHRLMWLDAEDDDSVDNDDDAATDHGSRGIGKARHSGPELYPNNAPLRRTAGTERAVVPTSTGKSTSSRRQHSKFRELLADAIGLTPRTAPAITAAKAPVDDLLLGAEDRYLGRDTRRMNTARLGQRPAATAPLIDVEGQAAGLVARLNRS